MLKIGILGAAGMRASAYKRGLEATGKAEVTAACDLNMEKLKAVTADWGRVDLYDDYDEMLQKANLDVVILSTPVPMHADQAIKALSLNVTAYCEVPAAGTIEDCKRIVKAANRSKAEFIMAENLAYTRTIMQVGNMIEDGLFGDVYYYQGEYLHDIKQFFNTSPWRKKTMANLNGINYGTHSLAPMLYWMKGDRISKVMCVGTGHHYIDDTTGEQYGMEDSCLMHSVTEQGRYIDIRLEFMSTRPYEMNFRVQGTKGVYEDMASLDGSKISRLWVEEYFDGIDVDRWMELDIKADKYIPDIWRTIPQEIIRTASFGGADYVTMQELVAHLRKERRFATCLHEAMDLTIPGIISTESINNGSNWMDVPNSRDW